MISENRNKICCKYNKYMKNTTAFRLTDIPLFSGLDDSQIKKTIPLLKGVEHTFEKGNTIIREGDKSGKIGIVLYGSAAVFRHDWSGERRLFVMISPLQMFGEALVFTEKNEFAISILAISRCRILFIDGKALNSPSVPEAIRARITKNLLRLLSEKNLKFRRKIDILSRKTTEEKLLFYLYIEASEHGENSFTIPYTRQELADYLGVDRSALSTVIGKLVKEGKITTQRNFFTLNQKQLD